MVCCPVILVAYSHQPRWRHFHRKRSGSPFLCAVPVAKVMTTKGAASAQPTISASSDPYFGADPIDPIRAPGKVRRIDGPSRRWSSRLPSPSGSPIPCAIGFGLYSQCNLTHLGEYDRRSRPATYASCQRYHTMIQRRKTRTYSHQRPYDHA